MKQQIYYTGDSALSFTSGEDRFDGMPLSNKYLLTRNHYGSKGYKNGTFGFLISPVDFQLTARANNYDTI